RLMNSLMTIRMRCGRCHRSELIAVVTYRRGMPLKSGDKAPDFALVDQHGEKFHLPSRSSRGSAPRTLSPAAMPEAPKSAREALTGALRARACCAPKARPPRRGRGRHAALGGSGIYRQLHAAQVR